MKVFISADIEGIATTVQWSQTSKNEWGYEAACRQMTAEVAAACEGAVAAGAKYIRVKDAHGSGTNIDANALPSCAELTSGGSGTPWSMVYGIQEGFDAAMFVGYHSAAGRDGNPLSHTETTSTVYVKLNGVKLSEFHMYSLACAYAHVPSVFLAGDAMLCEDSATLHPKLVTVPVKTGKGGSITALQPALACERIRKGAESALRQDLSGALCEMPPRFTLDICYKEHVKALRASSFPGFRQIDDNTVRMSTRGFYDIMRALIWVL